MRGMKMKRNSGVLVFFLVLLFFLRVSPAKKDEARDWLKDVSLIITDSEKAEFKNLKNAKDIEDFVKLFWARKDPTPFDEKNEFKEEFYRRLEYVKKAFIYGYKYGLETDQGKVYISFGKPSKVFDHGAGTQEWVYAAQPWMNYPKPSFNVVFTHDGTGFALDTSRTESRVIQTLYAYPKIILLYPNLTKVPEYKKVLSFSPESFEGKLINEVSSSGQDVVNILFEEKAYFTKAENVSIYVSFLLKITPPQGSELLPEKMTFFGRVKSEAYSSDFRLERSLIKEKDYFISQFGFPNAPGEYELFLGCYSPDKKAYSLKKSTIEIPNFWNEELGLSSLIASSQVKEAAGEKKKEEFDMFSLGRYSLLPCFSQEYTKEDSLNVFYYIYNIGLNDGGNCSLLIEFELRKGQKTFTLSPQKRTQNMGREAILLEGTQIPLAALPEQGEYELTVKVTDELSGKSASRKLKFFLM